GLKNLELLDLTNTGVGDKTVKNVSTLHHLTMLDLTGSTITVDALKYLAQLPRLSELYLNDTRLKASDLKQTCFLPALKKLHLARLNLHEQLPQLPSHLQLLDLQSTSLTDSALSGIERLSH